jgi:hypothetical protein
MTLHAIARGDNDEERAITASDPSRRAQLMQATRAKRDPYITLLTI